MVEPDGPNDDLPSSIGTAHSLARRSLLQRAMALTTMTWPFAARAGHALAADERVLFLPSTARQTEDGRIEADVHAWVYEPEHRRGLNRAFARVLGLRLSTMSPDAQSRFRARAALFHTDSERGKRVEVVFDGNPPLALPPTDAAGRTQARVVVGPPAGAATWVDPWVHFHAELAQGEPPRAEGRVLLVPPEGLSVISDIDDTIKRTDVRDRREMLLNTFARPFEAAPGMAMHYRRLAQQADTRLHYLSSSPIQLLPALSGFMDEAGFPPGSMHLRESTRWRTLVPGDGESRAHKLDTIARLLADFPRRRFLLVGDSGEADPEIYGEVARAQPERVEAIVIRDVTSEGRDVARYRDAFDGVDPARWHLLPHEGGTWPAR